MSSDLNNISNIEWDLIENKKTEYSKTSQKIDGLEKKMESMDSKLDLIILLLKQNRKLYTQALKQVEEKEDKTYNEVKNKTKSQTVDINRISNLIWRGGLTTPNLSINTLSLTRGINNPLNNQNFNQNLNQNHQNEEIDDDEDNSMFRSAKLSTDSLDSIE
jgi:hypothetical protein